jgi:hypothetical protein
MSNLDNVRILESIQTPYGRIHHECVKQLFSPQPINVDALFANANVEDPCVQMYYLALVQLQSRKMNRSKVFPNITVSAPNYGFEALDSAEKLAAAH